MLTKVEEKHVSGQPRPRARRRGRSVPSKMDTRVLPFKALKVIGTDTGRSAAYNFQLVIHSNHGPISYSFRDIQRFRMKIAIFFHPRVFIAYIKGGSHRNFATAVELNILECYHYQIVKRTVTMYPFVYTQYRHWTDRQTDGQNW